MARFQLSFEERLDLLAYPIPTDLVKSISDGTFEQSYIEWHTAVAILQTWFEGNWSSRFDGPHYQDIYPIPVTSLKGTSIKNLAPGASHDSEPVVWQREITGTTTIEVYWGDQRAHHSGVGQDLTFTATKFGWIYNDKGVTSVESHSFKRAATKFGIGLELYNNTRRNEMYDYLYSRSSYIIRLQRLDSIIQDLVTNQKLDPVEALKTKKYLQADPSESKIRQVEEGLSSRTA